jgi:hypothetical protein
MITNPTCRLVPKGTCSMAQCSRLSSVWGKGSTLAGCRRVGRVRFPWALRCGRLSP